MAKLITKFKYLKPAARQSVGGYAKYIATREGVEKVDDTFKTDPSTEKQKKLIERILRDFPDSNSMFLIQPVRNIRRIFFSYIKRKNSHTPVSVRITIKTNPGNLPDLFFQPS